MLNRSMGKKFFLRIQDATKINLSERDGAEQKTVLLVRTSAFEMTKPSPKTSHARQNAFVAVPATGHNRARRIPLSFFLFISSPPSRLRITSTNPYPNDYEITFGAQETFPRPDEFRNLVMGLSGKSLATAHHRP